MAIFMHRFIVKKKLVYCVIEFVIKGGLLTFLSIGMPYRKLLHDF